jgi:hypothetical protein
MTRAPIPIRSLSRVRPRVTGPTTTPEALSLTTGGTCVRDQNYLGMRNQRFAAAQRDRPVFPDVVQPKRQFLKGLT